MGTQSNSFALDSLDIDDLFTKDAFLSEEIENFYEPNLKSEQITTSVKPEPTQMVCFGFILREPLCEVPVGFHVTLGATTKVAPKRG